MKAILNSLKPNMRRLLAFSLACLTAASALAVFTIPAAAAPVSDVKVWKWKRVNSKSDVKAILNGGYNDVTVPVYLCWETPFGDSYVLQGTGNGFPYGIGDDGFVPFYRDGAYVAPLVSQMPTDMVPYYKKYLQENYPSQVEQYGGLDVFFAMRGNAYINNFYKDVAKDSKAAWATSPAAKRLFSGSILYNKTSWLMMANQGFPQGVSTSSESGLFYGSETFYTDRNTSDVTMTVDSSDLSVYFKCGKSCLVCSTFGLLDTTNFYVNHPGVSWWEVDPSKSPDAVSFTIEPCDTKNDRAQYTDAGKLQLTHTVKGQTGGLCFDGNYVDMLIQDDKKPTYFSNFTLYYGVESTVTELEGDYTVKKGVTQNFNNNMIIGAGSHLVIEPGATVTVTGLLQNKGTIENCGTLIVNENSAIMTTGEGTIKNYGNTADVPSMYYRTKVELATAEYEKKMEQLSKEWGYTYYNPMMAIEADIELYGQLAESLKNNPDAYAYYKKIYDEKCAEKQALLDKTTELRAEYEYFQKNRDKIIRDAIASYYNDEMSKADATAEYEKNFAELEKRMSEEYLKPRAALEQELAELKEQILTEEWNEMSVAERQKWQETYLRKQKELSALIENTQGLVDDYNYYKDNRDKIIEEIFVAHGGTIGTMTLAEAAEEYGKNLAALKKEVDEKYTKPEAKLKAELDSMELTYEQRARMSQEEYAAWAKNRAAKQAEYNQLIKDTKDLLAEYEYYQNNRDKIIDEIYAENGGQRADNGETVTYTDCSGDLVVLENGALFFDDETAAPLSLYSGATFMNAGAAVLPRGFLIADAELQNVSTGHIFSGFYMANTSFSGATVSYPGTKNATMANMKTADNGECVASGEYYLNNEGTIICHGGYVFADSLNKTSGLDRMFMR